MYLSKDKCQIYKNTGNALEENTVVAELDNLNIGTMVFLLIIKGVLLFISAVGEVVKIIKMKHLL